MSARKILTIVSFCCLFPGHSLFSKIILEGVVTNNGSEPVQNALVELTDQADANRKFSDYTNEQGQYTITIDETGVEDSDSRNPSAFNLLQNYPNPFNPSTVIAYELSKPAVIRIEIYNILGRKIKTLFDGIRSDRSGQIIWDATDDLGQGIPAGVYIYSLSADGIRINRKMLLIDGHKGGSNPTLSKNRSASDAVNKQLSNQYTLRITGNDIAAFERQDIQITGNTVLDVTVVRTVTDIDGNTYRTVKIGSQWWMAENLKTTRYRNGDAIPNVTGDASWSNLGTGAYCCYNNDANDAIVYGRFYNWYAVIDSRNIAPAGWHIPNDDEWKQLEMHLGMSRQQVDSTDWRGNVGGKLKEAGTAHWQSPNPGATNEAGFSALGMGCRLNSGGFLYRGFTTDWWSSTEVPNGGGGWMRNLNIYQLGIARNEREGTYGFPIRCLKD